MNQDQFMFEHWVEALSAVLLLLGFLFALVIQSPVMHSIVIILAGFLAGRVLYDRHRVQPIFPFILMIVGFLFGFMLGAIAANKLLLTILFTFSLAGSYWAHKRGYIEFFKAQGFLK
jgi:hypothetical protein